MLEPDASRGKAAHRMRVFLAAQDGGQEGGKRRDELKLGVDVAARREEEVSASHLAAGAAENARLVVKKVKPLGISR